MATDILTTLEFDRIQTAVANQCQFAVAADHAREFGPSSDPSTVRYLLRVTDEAYRLLEEQPGFGVGGCRDVRSQVERAEIGGVLQPDELLDVAATIAASRSVKRSFRRVEESEQRFPELDEFVGFIVELPAIEESIRRCIGEKGDVLDSASDALRTIRQQLRTAHGRLLERINRYLQHAAIQDPLVTQRDGRYVVPVRADRRGQLRGVVHDTSASGQTLYVEPMDVVDLNNRWRELQVAERHEIERILTALSSQVGGAANELSRTIEALSAIDLALAKARYASTTRSTLPAISDEQSPEGRRVILRRARHPLLDPATVVPIDLELGTSFRVLVVTGPNTGGKTVALKTLGLLSVMAQSGLFVPADEGCELPVFDGIFADIGDEQSIERSLSTFSGHVRRLIDILDAAGSRSLVLLDELAAGTDPGEGAALAVAVLDTLMARGALTLVTTHHHELKGWASETDAAANAAVGFDAEHLLPTFELRVGEPGASQALDVAERLGLPGSILADARERLGKDRQGMEALLRDAAAARVAAEEERDRAYRERDEAARARRDVETRERELAKQVERVRASVEKERQRARDEAEQDLAGLRAELETFRKEVAAARREERRRKARQETGRHEAERDRRLGAAAEAATRAAAHLTTPAAASVSDEPIGVGDAVIVGDLGVRGTVVAVSGNEIEVQGPSARLKLKRSRVMRDHRVVAKPSSAPVREVRPETPAVSGEIDVRGERAEAARSAVRAYIDDAATSGRETVRIIHGRGTGALRAAITDELRSHPLVGSSRMAGPDEGGDGATIAVLR